MSVRNTRVSSATFAESEPGVAGVPFSLGSDVGATSGAAGISTRASLAAAAGNWGWRVLLSPFANCSTFALRSASCGALGNWVITGRIAAWRAGTIAATDSASAPKAATIPTD